MAQQERNYTLVGVDGNAFCVMAYTSEAMRHCGVEPKTRNAYIAMATSGDYNNLLATSVDVLNKLNNYQPINFN